MCENWLQLQSSSRNGGNIFWAIPSSFWRIIIVWMSLRVRLSKLQSNNCILLTFSIMTIPFSIDQANQIQWQMPCLELLKIHMAYYLSFQYPISLFWTNSNPSWLFTLSSLNSNGISEVTRQACLIILLLKILFYTRTAFGCPMASTLSCHCWWSSIRHLREGTWESRKLCRAWGRILFGTLYVTTFDSSLLLTLTVNIPNMKHGNPQDYFIIY